MVRSAESGALLPLKASFELSGDQDNSNKERLFQMGPPAASVPLRFADKRQLYHFLGRNSVI
jgi:hypothetical protein